MAEMNKASELLAKMREKAGLPEPIKKESPIEKALAKKDEPEYIWGYIKQMSTGQYLAGRESEGDPYFIEDYREASYMKLEKGTGIDLPDWLIESVADPELGIDDFMFIEAEIKLKD